MTDEDTAIVCAGFMRDDEITVSHGTPAAFIFMKASFSSHSRHQLQAANCVAAMRPACRKPSAADVTS
jgi:hypothetical protein